MNVEWEGSPEERKDRKISISQRFRFAIIGRRVDENGNTQTLANAIGSMHWESRTGNIRSHNPHVLNCIGLGLCVHDDDGRLSCGMGSFHAAAYILRRIGIRYHFSYSFNKIKSIPQTTWYYRHPEWEHGAGVERYEIVAMLWFMMSTRGVGWFDLEKWVSNTIANFRYSRIKRNFQNVNQMKLQRFSRSLGLF